MTPRACQPICVDGRKVRRNWKRKERVQTMSAYVVEKELIDKLVSAAIDAGFFGEDKATAKGQMLWRENVVSVAYRYNLATRDPAELAEYNGDVEAYTFQFRAYEDEDIDKGIDCLDYQSCEHDGWETSEAHAFLGDLRVAFPEMRGRPASIRDGRRA